MQEEQLEKEQRKKLEEQQEEDEDNKGIYNLVIKLDKGNSIDIGKLGSIKFPEGYYVYTGSALNYLDKRILRHFKKKKKFHWHIDYFLKYAKIIKVFTLNTILKLECEVNRQIQMLPNAKIIIKGFGCSDCKCLSHLTFFGNNNPSHNIKKLYMTLLL